MDTITRNQMLQAKKLIEKKQYNKAKKMLRNIENDTAKKWVSKINKIQSRNKTSSGRTRKIVLLIGAILILSVLVMYVNNNNNISSRISDMRCEYTSESCQ